MADTYKTLISVDTVTSVSDTDYVIVNDSDTVKQITKANLLSDLASTVSENSSDIATNTSDISDLDTRVTTLEGGTITTDTTLSVSGMAADAKAVGDELNLFIENVTIVDNIDTVGSSAMPKTRRWFFTNIIPKGSYIGDIQYRTARAVSGTVDFEIWSVSGTTLTRETVISSTPSSTSTITETIDYTTTNNCMISIRPTDGTSIRFEAETSFALYDVTDLDSTTLDTSDLAATFTTYTPCAYITYTTSSFQNLLAVTDNVITIGEGLDYEEIQEALVAISDDSENNPYTLLVFPKGSSYAPFSMIRDSFSDSYLWSDVSPRYISIIGMDKKHCVIQSDSGAYYYPCGELMTNGVISNLSFKMTNDEQYSSATQGGYCLHIDCRTLDDVGYDMLIENCDFEDASGPCMGIGMHANCTLKIKDCCFKTTLSSSYAPFDGYTNLYDYGCVFVHTSTLADATGQYITFENCTGTCAEGSKSLWLATAGSYDASTSEFVYTLLRNIFWNETAEAHGITISSTLTANPMNYGNNNT